MSLTENSEIVWKKFGRLGDGLDDMLLIHKRVTQKKKLVTGR